MDIDHWIKILEVIVSLLQVLVWPAIALFALLLLGTTLRNYLNDLRKDRNVSEMSTEVGTSGVKFTIKRQVEAASLLIRANELGKSEASPDNKQTLPVDKTQKIIDLVTKVATPQAIQKVAGAKVLWVDDKPSNNMYPRKALEAFGIQFTLSTSTQDALEKVDADTYAVIISDFKRLPDEKAGFTLLEALRKQHITTPFLLFAGADRSYMKAETIRRGGDGVALSYQELFQLVIDAIQKA
jgi:CheY-like chemotaxis protein